MKTKIYSFAVSPLLCAIMTIAAINLYAQNDYSVDWGDTSTFDVTCGKVISSKWSVKNDSCIMTTPFIRVEYTGGAMVSYTFKVNQSGNGEVTDRAYVFHSIDTGDWVLDTMWTAGGMPKVFTYSDHVFMDYTHYVRFRVHLRTNSNTEFWSINGGQLNVTDGYPSEQRIMVYSSRPPVPLQGPGEMPVELMSFTGQASNELVRLSWMTASETNNDFFTIEKSIDGNLFEPIGYVDGAGTSDIKTAYLFYDTRPYDLTYYKLKQTDFDGNFTYSGIITVNAPASNTSNVQISAIGDMLFLQTNADESGMLQIQIYDLCGKLIYSKSININDSQYIYAIKPEKKVGALYLVHAGFENKNPTIVKVYLN